MADNKFVEEMYQRKMKSFHEKEEVGLFLRLAVFYQLSIGPVV